MGKTHLTNDVLLDLLDGRGRPEDRAHLDACGDCRAALEALKPVRRDLSELSKAAAPSEDSELVHRILDRTGPASRRRIYKRRASPWRWIAGAAAAAVAVIAVVLSVQKPADPPAPRTVDVPAPEVIVPPRPQPVPSSARPELRVPEGEIPTPSITPKPSTAPTPKPAPQPKPPAPAPKPEPAPEPEKPPAPPAPKQTKPEPVFVVIARIEGPIEKLTDPGRWDSRTPIRAGSRVARITLADGVRVTLAPKSELVLQAAKPPTLALIRGRVYFDVPPVKGRDFRVATPDARIAVTGTRFGVSRTSDRTQVIVSDGEVEVANDKGATRLPAGTGLTVQKLRAPGKPRLVDADAMLAWNREAAAPERSLVAWTFENGKRPYPMTSGVVDAGPARGLNRHCMKVQGSSLTADLARVDRKHTVYRDSLLVRVRFYATDGKDFWIQFFSRRHKDNFRFHLRGIQTGRWETFELPLSEFYRLSDKSRLEDGDLLTWLSMGVTGATGPVYIDDFQLVEVQTR